MKNKTKQNKQKKKQRGGTRIAHNALQNNMEVSRFPTATTTIQITFFYALDIAKNSLKLFFLQCTQQ